MKPVELQVPSTVTVLLLTSFLSALIQPSRQYSIALDIERDLYRAWKLTGNYLYVPNGLQLKQFYDKFPEAFEFRPFLGTKGIWITFPQIAFAAGVNRVDAHSAELSAANYSGSYTSFGYTGAAQLIESVTIRYCMGGQANITVSQDGDEAPFYTISPGTGTGRQYEWITTNVPLGEGSSRFVVQANVNTATDFVLVDKIEGFFVEITTVRPTTTRRTTTAKPPGSLGHNFTDGSYRSVVLALMFACLCNFL